MNEELRKKMSVFMYHLVKNSARESFVEFLEDINLTMEEYCIIRNEWIEKLGIDKPYI